MGKKIRTLLIGESWMVQTTETKGFDSFTVSYYETGIQYIQPILSTDEFEFTHMPCHRITSDFPETVEGLLEYDAIIISDVGANTFLLPVETFLQCNTSPNKLEMLKEYVLRGGGLCMAGGYMSFMGIEGKGKYHYSPLEEVLPVEFLPCDDRMEHPEGFTAEIKQDSHPVLAGLGNSIGNFLGYNKAIPKPEAEILAEVFGDPFIAVGSYGKGRGLAFASDIAPHWSSHEFCQKEEYGILWRNIVSWLAQET